MLGYCESISSGFKSHPLPPSRTMDKYLIFTSQSNVELLVIISQLHANTQNTLLIFTPAPLSSYLSPTPLAPNKVLSYFGSVVHVHIHVCPRLLSANLQEHGSG